MDSKNRFIAVGLALTYSLLLPNTSFSEVIKPSGLYISGKYKPSVSIFSDFSVKETNVTTKGLIALKKEVSSIDIPSTNPHNTEGLGKPSNFNISYTAEFQDNFASFSGAIGYPFFKGLRIEVEISYEKFDVKNPGDYIVNDAFRHFALARQIEGKKENVQPKKPTTSWFIRKRSRNK
ncbi:P44/Msp2 family outer membrane protein [Ehrlichia sp. JZT12]